MKYLLPCISVAILLVLSHCKSSSYLPNNYPDEQIVFGSGGGFAGTYNYYYLLKDGSLFQNSSSDTTFQKVKKIDQAEVKQLFANVALFDLKNYTLNDPGNMNYFIEFRAPNESHKIQWGGRQQTVDPKIKTIYQILNNFLQ